jgi:uncharacterized membrane protein YphA (DoxX/SURF4 family)
LKSVPVAGRYLFPAAILAFGIQNILYARSGAYLGPPWTPAGHVLAFFLGVALALAGVIIAIGGKLPLAEFVVVAITLLRAGIVYLPRLAATPRDPDPWTNGFELLGIAGAGLVLAVSWTDDDRQLRRGVGGILWLLGRILFAVSLVVFAIQHFMYARFVATMVTPWIPGKLFWAWFVGFAFVASAIAIVGGKLGQLAATLLGIMFLLWVVILHAPRVLADLHNGYEWTNLLVALAFGGGAFIIAGAAEE